MSDGTGVLGDDGDIVIRITNGASATVSAILVDHSAL